MESWYNFLIKIKPDGKAFRSIFFSRIFYEVLANALQVIKDYAILNINDQVWYVNDNFNPEPWERRYQINVPQFATLEERRQLVKSYMVFPQYANRLSLDYFQISLNNADYDTAIVQYNITSGDATSKVVRMTTDVLSSGNQEILISGGGYVDDAYDFKFQAYDSSGIAIFPIYVSKTNTGITLNMPEQGTVTITTIKEGDTLGDASRITTEILDSDDQDILISGGGYSDANYDFTFQAYDSQGVKIFPSFVSKTSASIKLNMPEQGTVTITTLKTGDTLTDAVRMNTDTLSPGNQTISIPDGGYIDTFYELTFQAYDSQGYAIFPIFVSKSTSNITLNMPEEGVVTISTLGIITTIGDEFMHANDFSDEKLTFNIGSLIYNSFIVDGEISSNSYKNVIYLLMSLKPPQVVLYDRIDVLTAIAIDDNFALAIDDTLATTLTTL